MAMPLNTGEPFEFKNIEKLLPTIINLSHTDQFRRHLKHPSP